MHQGGAGWLPYALLIAGSAWVLFQILLVNAGKLIYTLDDPYIHLAVAENIARGTYGVNLGESSAPSSSILYPFLLAPFAASAILEWVPLAINFVAALGTVWLWSRIVTSALDGTSDTARRILTVALVTLLIPATNLIGVMFTGMEHSLQLLAAALLVAGLAEERESGRVTWWLWTGIILGPLVRYESLALSLPALAYLFVRGWRRSSLGVLALVVLLLGAFSAYLVASGHGILPTSVLVKSGAVRGGTLGAIIGVLVRNLFQRQAAVLIVLGALFAAAIFTRLELRDRQLAAWGAVAIALHLMLGGFDYFHRYELYVLSAALLTALLVFQTPLRQLVSATRLRPLLVAASGVAFAVGYPYIYATLKTPLGSNNIYEQQYQMHRFAKEFYQGPVAVNDLGWVAFRNDQYVLDLWGLAHKRAADARMRGDDSYIADMAREHDVEFAILYHSWFPNLPENWKPIAKLRLGKPQLTPAHAVVTFYSLNVATEPRIRSLLEDFGATLPQGATLNILP